MAKHEKCHAAQTRKFSHGADSPSAATTNRKHRNASVSTSQRWTNRQNLESRQNLIPLISGPTSQTRKQPDKNPTSPGPAPPSPKAKGKQHSTPLTADSKQEGGLRFAKKKKKASAGTRGLARVNSSAFYTVNTRQTSAERCRRDYREDLRHLGIYPRVPHFDLMPLHVWFPRNYFKQPFFFGLGWKSLYVCSALFSLFNQDSVNRKWIFSWGRCSCAVQVEGKSLRQSASECFCLSFSARWKITQGYVWMCLQAFLTLWCSKLPKMFFSSCRSTVCKSLSSTWFVGSTSIPWAIYLFFLRAWF